MNLKKINTWLIAIIVCTIALVGYSEFTEAEREYDKIINANSSLSEKEVALYSFVEKYPNSEYADLARDQASNLAEEIRVAKLKQMKLDSIDALNAPFREAQRKKNLERFGPVTDSNHDDGMALEMAKDFVEKRLKSPSTAKHGRFYESEVTVEKVGRNYTINSYVDSQNGFGAMIRTYYTAKVQYQGNGTWSLIELDFK